MNGEAYWLAGFLDARGCIGIGIDIDTRQSAVRLEGSSCDPDILKRVQEIAGGTIQKRPSDKRGGHAIKPERSLRYGYRSNGLRKRLYRWQCCGEKAVAILREIAPLLVSEQRKQRAIEAIQYFEKRRSEKRKQTNDRDRNSSVGESHSCGTDAHAKGTGSR